MWNTFEKANYLVLVPGILAYFLGVGFRTLRWQVLLSGIDKIKIQTLFPIVVIGYMANNILPFRLGELIRGYYLKNKTGVPTATALSTIFVERIMDGLALILILAGSSMSVPFNTIFSRLSQKIFPIDSDAGSFSRIWGNCQGPIAKSFFLPDPAVPGAISKTNYDLF